MRLKRAQMPSKMKTKSAKKKFIGDSDTNITVEQHAQLINDVLNLNKKTQLQIPSRTEPTTQISEFNLVKSGRGHQGTIRVDDLSKVLKGKASRVEISKKLKNAEHETKTLQKPLEKPHAERIRRTVAFSNVKEQLGRWDAVVTSNRASNHLTFPLLANTKLEASKNFTGFRIKTDLQKKLEALEPKVEVFNLEKPSEYPLTMQEMLERRKDLAKMRAVQSYKEAKARRQGKIKSKKYHRVQRQDRIKKQMKEFEELQKTNPEEALKKLDEIERVRAEERASLRHRSTGQWAKSKQVRAKYDKESRQVLAQQLQISRDLTQKTKAATSDSESEEEPSINQASLKSSDNPWTNPLKTTAEVEEFVSSYRKFWESESKKVGTNENEVKSTESPNSDAIGSSTSNVVEEEHTESPSHGNTKKDRKGHRNAPKETQQISKLTKNNIEKMPTEPPSPTSNKTERKEIEKSYKKNKNISKSINDDTEKTHKEIVEARGNLNVQIKRKSSSEIKASKTNKKFIATTSWDVSNLSEDSEETEEIDDIFETFNDKIKNRLQQRYAKIKTNVESQKKQKAASQIRGQQKKSKKEKPQKQKSRSDLNLPKSATRPIIDEELIESVEANKDPEYNVRAAVFEAVMKSSSITDEIKKNSVSKPINNIDPNNIIKTKAVNLNTDIPDLLELDENEESADQRGTIMEAFEDDDVLEEFKKDKQKEIEGEKPTDINLTLPGWGSWGGTGIKPSKRKNKRFIIKFPKQFKRRDENKGNLIINEKADVKVKSHLVSELPFPFKSVKDFEASIRAPVGSTFVPETAFRKMIRPAISTKLGTVIEPMTEDILVKKKK